VCAKIRRFPGRPADEWVTAVDVCCNIPFSMIVRYTRLLHSAGGSAKGWHVTFDRPIANLFRYGIIASGVAAMLSAQMLCLSAAYAGDPGTSAQSGSLNSGALTPHVVADRASGPVSELSAAAQRISQVAERNGDQNFLVIDKVEGRITAFEHGTPTFSGAALTGESLTDIIPQDAFSKSFAETRGLKYKVTPAGRFTVSPGYDPAYGETLDINEVHGKDWDVSIHRVWLGAPSEHRDVRLRTATGQDKHITYGCIDVDADTMRQLLRHMTRKARVPLYILPVNEHLEATLFLRHDFARDTAGPVARSAVRMVGGSTSP
jgi:hypothetical protein